MELRDRRAALRHTECGALGAIVPAWATDRAKRFSTNGIPLPGVELEIRDPDTGERCPPGVPGEICFRGWGRFLEYVDLAAETAESIDEDEFFHSGDYGHVDEDGWLYFQGRYKMMIKTGGENVAEREVEVFLEEHLPQVEFAQVVGVPDPVWGEAVTAFVQLSEPVSSETLRGVRAGRSPGTRSPSTSSPWPATSSRSWPTVARTRQHYARWPSSGWLDWRLMDRLDYELGLTRDILENTNLSIWDMFRRSVTRHADRPAVRMGEEVWTYAELLDRARRSATALHELGVTKGTRVAFLFHSCPEWAVLHYALSRLGAVAVPINLAFQSHELRHALGAAEPELVIAVESFRGADFTARLRAVDAAMVDGATEVPSLPSVRWVGLLPLNDAERPVPTHPSVSAVFGSPGTAALLPEPGAAEPWDAAYIVFTSGSTAFPKPALIAHRAFLGAATGFVHALDMRPEDSFLAMLPTFHVGGVTCVLSAPHLSGGCADLMGAFEPALALRTIEQCRSTVTVGFDTMYTKMTGADEFAATDVSSLRKSLLACTPSYIDKLRGSGSSISSPRRTEAPSRGPSRRSCRGGSTTTRSAAAPTDSRCPEWSSRSSTRTPVSLVRPESSARSASEDGAGSWSTSACRRRTPPRSTTGSSQWRLRAHRCGRVPALPGSLQAGW